MAKHLRAAAALWLALTLTLPVCAAQPETLVPVGRTVGLELETEGLYVAGFEEEDGESPAQAAGLQAGDRLLSADGRKLDRAETLRELAGACGGAPLLLAVERDGRTLQIAVRPAMRGGTARLGLRVRDRISGLGTVTFYDPESGLFGALGHGVSGGGDRLLEIRGGVACEACITEIRKGEAGTPGSLLGRPAGAETLGQVEQNTDRGLFGHAQSAALSGPALPLAARSQVSVGPAEILCGVDGAEPERYAVEIEAVRFDPDECRDLRLVVTDPRVLDATGGIVQGMSGSPILQNGRLVGAVTHVLVRDPTRGYGILIGHMLEGAQPQTAARDEAA